MPDFEEEARKAANRLHHLSMRYAGAMVELVANQPVGLLAKDHHGLKEIRDLVDLLLFTRAEINAHTALLIKAGLVKREDMLKEYAEQYEWLAQMKAKQLGVGITDFGITFSTGPKEGKN